MENNMAPLISVIIPIYNVENYIGRCVDSVLEQTYTNLEIILVNDGSTDNCFEICEELKNKDKRIKCIHKKNGGLSDARNVGVQNSTGKYVAFIDGDDFISKDYMRYLYELLLNNDADISICNYQKVYEEQLIKSKDKEKIVILSGEEGLENLLYQKYYTMSAWAKMYKIDVIKNIEFPVGKIHEDVGTIYKYMSNSKKTVYGSKKMYGYVQRDKSIVNSKFNIAKMDYIEFTKEIIKYVENEKKNLYRAAVSRHFSACFQMILQVPRDSKGFHDVYLELIDEIDKYKKIVAGDKKARVINRVAAMLSFVSIEYTIKLLKIMKKS